MYRFALALLLSAILAAPALAVDGVMLRNDTLRATASPTGKAVVLAKKNAKVTILIRQGAWTQVRAAGKSGWVRLLSVRANAGGSGSAGLKDVTGLTDKRDPTKVVSVAGMRGLDEEELRSAKYDAAQLQKLETWAVAADETRRFAETGTLMARKLAYLPAPKPKPENGGNPLLEGF